MSDVTFGYPGEWDLFFGVQQRVRELSADQLAALWRKQRNSGALVELCACGCPKKRCVPCGEWFCNATGHLPHVCAVTSREGEGAT